MSWFDGGLQLRVATTGKEYRWSWKENGGFGAPIAHTRRWVFLNRCRNQLCRVLAAKLPT